MNHPLASIRISNPALTVGRDVRAFALPPNFTRQWFHGFSGVLFQVPAAGRR